MILVFVTTAETNQPRSRPLPGARPRVWLGRINLEPDLAPRGRWAAESGCGARPGGRARWCATPPPPHRLAEHFRLQDPRAASKGWARGSASKGQARGRRPQTSCIVPRPQGDPWSAREWWAPRGPMERMDPFPGPKGTHGAPVTACWPPGGCDRIPSQMCATGNSNRCGGPPIFASEICIRQGEIPKKICLRRAGRWRSTPHGRNKH